MHDPEDFHRLQIEEQGLLAKTGDYDEAFERETAKISIGLSLERRGASVLRFGHDCHTIVPPEVMEQIIGREYKLGMSVLYNGMPHYVTTFFGSKPTDDERRVLLRDNAEGRLMQAIGASALLESGDVVPRDVHVALLELVSEAELNRVLEQR